MKASKKLIASLFALVIAASLAATTTFAWFTMNDTVELGNFDVTVTSVTPGLFVSTKEGVGYTTSLDLGDYIGAALSKYSADNSGTDFKMKDIAWDGTKKEMTNETGTATGGTALTHDMANVYNASTAKSGYTVLVAGGTRTQDFEYNMLNGYLSFNLYFRGDGKYDIRLTDSSAVTPVGSRPAVVNAYPWKDMSTSGAVYGTNVVGATSTTTTPLDTRAANAARVMFNTTPGLVGDAGTPVTKIWEPNATEGFSQLRAGALAPGAGVRNLAQDVKAILFGLATDDTLTSVAAKFPLYTANILDTDLATVDLVRLAQSGGAGAYYCKMTVSLWLEGWDEDCLNSILTDKLDLALEVKAFAVT